MNSNGCMRTQPSPEMVWRNAKIWWTVKLDSCDETTMLQRKKSCRDYNENGQPLKHVVKNRPGAKYKLYIIIILIQMLLNFEMS